MFCLLYRLVLEVYVYIHYVCIGAKHYSKFYLLNWGQMEVFLDKIIFRGTELKNSICITTKYSRMLFKICFVACYPT